jgi:hypothetical protein
MERECDMHFVLLPETRNKIWTITNQGPIKKQIRLNFKILEIIKGDGDAYNRIKQLAKDELPTQHDNDYFAQNHAMASVSMKKDAFECWVTQQEPNAPFKLKQTGF